MKRMQSALAMLLLAAPLHAVAPPTLPDPLPKGAIARLGHARMVFPRPASFCVSPDGRWAVCDGVCFDLVVGRKRSAPVHVPENYSLVRLFSGSTYVVRGKEDYLLFRANEEPLRFTGPSLEWYRVDFDARGFTGLHIDKDVHLADLRPKGPVNWRKIAALSPDEGYVRLSDSGGHVVWWDAKKVRLSVHEIASGKTKAFDLKLNLKDARLAAFAIGPDGKRVAILSGTALQVIDTKTGKLIREVRVPSSWGWEGSEFTPDGKSVLIHDWERYVLVPVEGSESPVSVPIEGASRDFYRKDLYAPVADSKRLVTLDKFGVLRVRDLKTGKQLDTHSRFPPLDGVQFLDGDRAASWSRSGRVVVWNTRDGRVLSEALFQPDRNKNQTFGGMQFSRDGRHGVAWLDDDFSRPSTCWLMEAATGKVIARAPGFVAFHPSGKTVVFEREKDDKDEKRIGTYFDLTRREWGRSIRFPKPSFHPQQAFSADDRSFLNANDYDVSLEEMASGKARWTTDLPRLKTRLGGVFAATLARSGRRAVVVRRCDAVALDTLTGRILAQVQFAELDSEANPQVSVCASGRWLAIKLDQWDEVALYDLEAEQSGNCILSSVPVGGITGVALDAAGSRLATSHGDGTCYVWDLKQLVSPPKKQKKKLGEPWEALASLDPADAQPAIVFLTKNGTKAVELFSRKLTPAKEVPPARIAAWVAELDSDDYDRRIAAERDLAAAADQAEDALRKAIRKPGSLEQIRRAERVLARIESKIDPVLLRQVRAAEILESLGTKEAIALLEMLAKGPPAARLTREAKSSLGRLKRREE